MVEPSNSTCEEAAGPPISGNDARSSVLMLGPLHPATGGMATVIGNLLRSGLARHYRLVAVNTAKMTPEGRPLLTAVRAQLRLLSRVVAALRRNRPQLVHIHTCSGITFCRDCLYMAVARLFSRRVVWHVHGGRFAEFLGALGPIRRALARQALSRAAGVIVLSDGWVRRLRPFAPRAHWYRLPNGVEIPPLEGTAATRSRLFVFLGNLSLTKGAADLVSAACKAVSGGFAGKVLLAGGEAQPGQKAALERQAAEAGCADRVRFLGVISSTQRDELLSSAWCLVLPSYAEGLPMALLEAMAHGVPVIATRVGAVPELITEGVEGFLIEPGDRDVLSDRLCRLDGDPLLQSRMGQAARRRVEADFSLDVAVDRLMVIYQEALKGT